MQRMLQIDENGGDVGNHNIYVHAYTANGDPLDGVVVCRAPNCNVCDDVTFCFGPEDGEPLNALRR